MIKQFDISSYPILSRVVDAIDLMLDCPKYKSVAHNIAIRTLSASTFGLKDTKEVTEKGFGNCVITSYDGTNFSVALIINTHNCEQAKLTDHELTAVILHELGPLLNAPELSDVPTFAYCFSYGLAFSKAIL